MTLTQEDFCQKLADFDNRYQYKHVDEALNIMSPKNLLLILASSLIASSIVLYVATRFSFSIDAPVTDGVMYFLLTFIIISSCSLAYKMVMSELTNSKLRREKRRYIRKSLPPQKKLLWPVWTLNNPVTQLSANLWLAGQEIRLSKMEQETLQTLRNEFEGSFEDLLSTVRLLNGKVVIEK